jgi:hypothetical protein
VRRQAGSLIYIWSRPQARRRRASGHTRGRRSTATRAAKSHSLWQPMLSRSFLYFRMVISRSTSGSASAPVLCRKVGANRGQTSIKSRRLVPLGLSEPPSQSSPPLSRAAMAPDLDYISPPPPSPGMLALISLISSISRPVSVNTVVSFSPFANMRLA